MFSPALQQEGGPAKGTRSNRRRQRPLSADASVQQPKAKRQRVPLAESTFVNPEAPPEMFEVKSDAVSLLSTKRDGVENVVPPRKDLSVRSKKPKAGERVSKGDGSIVLTSNNAYTVSKLPALPDRLRADAQSENRPNSLGGQIQWLRITNDSKDQQHGAIYSSNGYALDLTPTHAFVWSYTSTNSSPETFTFALPYPSKHASDPLPLGALVSPSASSDEPGLVIVMPVSGKIAYWESISSAATLDFLRQQRTGVEDSISGMFSGEHVVHIVNAESAGFVLLFSSGRLAYMNVRDSYGRPGISVQFLRNGMSSAAGGFFGSIRHALSASTLRGDIAAVRAGHGVKVGERVIVAATTKGKVHAWRVHRGGHHELLADVDIRDQLVEAVQAANPASARLPNDSFEVIDFTFVPRGLEKKHRHMSRLSEALVHDEDSLQHLLLLASLTNKRHTRYSIVEVVISEGRHKIGTVRPLTSYTSPVTTAAPEKPRLYLPRPGLVAFVIFDRAVVIASMAALPDSPESQLQEDSHIIPATFEDVIDFRDEGMLQIIGSGVEEPFSGYAQDEFRAHRHKTKNPAAVLLLQGVGTVRVAVTEVDRFASERPPKVTAKSKLEQAVFFGIKEDNPLVFKGKRDLPFTAAEIGVAAMELSNEIVTSKTQYISSLPASLENNMKDRVKYLSALIDFLNTAEIDLDGPTRWSLLYNAEKMAAATWIWQNNERFVAERPKGDKRDKTTIISETALYINEQQKTEPNSAIGEVDSVRHWFINDVLRLDIFIAWGYQIIKYHWTERLSDEQGINRLLWEAVTINMGSLLHAHQYRKQNAKLYGVDPDAPEGGHGVPAPWTSTHFVTNNLKRLIEFCYQWLETYYTPSANGEYPVNATLLEDVRKMLSPLTSQYFIALKEYSGWAARSNDAEAQALGKTYHETYVNDTYEKILKLKDFGLWDEAIGLAKKYEAFDSLADVIVQQILALEQGASTGTAALTINKSAAAKDEPALAEAKKREMGWLFDEYKEKFAFRAYTVLLENSGVQAVLDFPYDVNGYSTAFLRTRPELAKISWINDVEREKDIDHAAETLLDLGLTREQQVWNKKIELSLGKLALLAEETAPSVNGDAASVQSSVIEARNGANLDRIDQELEMIKIQDALYGQILPTIEAAVDEAAELELAVKEYGQLLPKKQKALIGIFETSMARLIKHEALEPWGLIDLLTLSWLDPHHVNSMGSQFFLALKVAKAGLKGVDRANAEKLIWRRCWLRDDWAEINETNEKADADQLEVLQGTAAWFGMYPGVDAQHRDESFNPYVKPSDTLGVFTETLDYRWEKMDEGYRAKMLDAMKAEDARLKNFIDKAQLNKWARTLYENVVVSVHQEYDRRKMVKSKKEKLRAMMALSAGKESGNGAAKAAGPVRKTGGLFG
ncbi:Nup133 N terminal like-domain-containing protein [Bombardia bombarda]|uniref:Nup133 N terminal like-domain-containing protein n=1 Tax=Bombardia bombarda TaxID=252184 RepID=A0AA39WGJ9_9PEZI|nr:Nup133 N terminal like-domain-containing protein [Bombardia bombarda]